ncbi:MAG: response regulator [Candidatus Latescibacterota bacterium]
MATTETMRTAEATTTTEELIDIKEVSALFGVSVESIRKYKNYRILRVADRRGNKDLYDKEEVLSRRNLVKEMQVQGMTLGQISEEIDSLFVKQKTQRRRNILAVDNDPALLGLMQSFLTDEGYRVSTCKDGTEALERAFTQAFDLIILDLQLPDMDGYEVCKRIRQNARLRNTPIIMVSGYYTDVQDRIRGIEEGADDCLMKPFDMGELKARIEMVLRRNSR